MGRQLILILCMMCVNWSHTNLRAQTPETEPPKDVLTKDIVTARKAQAAESKGLEEEQKTKLLEIYDRALTQLKTDEDNRAKLATFRKAQSEVVEKIITLRADLEQLEKEKVIPPKESEKQREPEQQLSQAATNLNTAEQTLQAVQQERLRRTKRVTDVPLELQAARKLLEELEKSVDTAAPPGEAPEVTTANQTLLRARIQALRSQIEMLQQELPAYTATNELMTLELRIAELRRKLAEERKQIWQSVVNFRKEKELATEAKSTQEAREAADPLLKEIAGLNEELAASRLSAEGLPARISQLTQDLQKMTDRAAQVVKDRTNTEEQLHIPGMESVIGPRLLRQKRSLPRLRFHRRNIDQRQDQISEARFELINLREEYERIQDVEKGVALFLANLQDTVTPQRRKKLESQARQIFQTRQDLQSKQITDYSTLINKLYELSVKEQELVNQTKTYLDLLDQQILWVRSTEKLDLKQLRNARTALTWLCSTENWMSVYESLEADLKTHAIFWSITALFLAWLFMFKQKIRIKLRDLNLEARKNPLLPFKTTLKAFALCILYSLHWPALYLLLGWRLSSSLWSSEFSQAVGVGFSLLGVVSFMLIFFRRVCRPEGFAESHFRWRRQQLRYLAFPVRWLIGAGMPAVFIVGITESQTQQRYSDSLGRMALIFGLTTVSFFIMRVFHLKDSLSSDEKAAVRKISNSELLGRAFLILFPLALACSAAAGYYYASTQMTWKLLWTLALVVCIILLRALILRWLYVARGKLALKQQHDSAAEKEEQPEVKPVQTTPTPENGATDSVIIEPSTEVEKKELLKSIASQSMNLQKKTMASDLALINAQTRRVVKLLVLGLFLIGGWIIWADVLPALGIFEYPLWSSVEEQSRMVPGSDIPQTIPVAKLITIKHLILAITLLTFTFIAGANLPGLMEVSLLQYLPLDHGGRYAAANLARYLVIIVGVIFSLGAMGIHWSQTQWLVAALSVGLGFGMQEIFANFVCGIILLFERPIRLGDVVTVDSVTGVVTKIRIRATTVRDWDHKEFIVPNKELITGRLLNWTLSNEVNRLVVTVGVAYGTDTDLAYDLIFQAAKSVPEISAEPSPSVTFDGFGDSSLNFTLRVYLPAMSLRLSTLHALHTKINQLFDKAGVTIPFPQRDLHIRSMEGMSELPMQSAPSDYQNSKQEP